MFTGIIQATGIVQDVKRPGEGGQIFIRKPTSFLDHPEIGESIAIQGVCLSLAFIQGDDMRFDVLDESFHRSSLGTWKQGSLVNMERALRYGDTLGGHIVSGHVDCVGRVREKSAVGRDVRVEIEAPADFMRSVVFKGSVGCDGISLTVAEWFADGFAVHLIPLTLEHTAWKNLTVGMPINLEADMLGKIALRMLEGKLPNGVAGLTWDDLKNL